MVRRRKSTKGGALNRFALRPFKATLNTMSAFSALTQTLRSGARLACALALLATAHAQQETVTFKAATVTLVADTAAVEAGKPFTAGVRIELDPDWDIYWQFVGSLGQATSVDWELPPGFKAGDLQWPLPVSHLSFEEFFNYVYFGETMLWWGFWLWAIDQPHGWVTIFAPLLMTFLLLRVSGVTMLDAHLRETKPAYADYIRRTSAFLPRPPRR